MPVAALLGIEREYRLPPQFQPERAEKIADRSLNHLRSLTFCLVSLSTPAEGKATDGLNMNR
jgi:hypothetical protein